MKHRTVLPMLLIALLTFGGLSSASSAPLWPPAGSADRVTDTRFDPLNPEGVGGQRIPIATPDETLSRNVEFVSQLGGSLHSAVIQGNFAYAGIGPRLGVIDISNPANPTLVRESEILPDALYFLDVSGNYAYAIGITGILHVLSITGNDPPQLIGSLKVADRARDIKVSGNLVFITAHEEGLKIVSVAVPSAPVLLGTYDTPDSAFGVAVQGNYAYVADYNSGLRVISVANPSCPRLD